MADNVVKFKSHKTVKPRKIRISQIQNSPIFELTNTQTQIIKKFIEFVKKDIQFQVELFNRSDMAKEKLEQNLYSAAFLREYMNVILAEVTKGDE